MAGSHLRRSDPQVDRRVVIVVVVVALLVGLLVGAALTWMFSDDVDVVAPFERHAVGAEPPDPAPAGAPWATSRPGWSTPVPT